MSHTAEPSGSYWKKRALRAEAKLARFIDKSCLTRRRRKEEPGPSAQFVMAAVVELQMTRQDIMEAIGKPRSSSALLCREPISPKIREAIEKLLADARAEEEKESLM